MNTVLSFIKTLFSQFKFSTLSIGCSGSGCTGNATLEVVDNKPNTSNSTEVDASKEQSNKNDENKAVSATVTEEQVEKKEEVITSAEVVISSSTTEQPNQV